MSKCAVWFARRSKSFAPNFKEDAMPPQALDFALFRQWYFYWCFPASLGTVGDNICTWSKLESPLQRQETSTKRAGQHLFWWSKNTMLLLVVFIKT
jgi:hypothetical protein